MTATEEDVEQGYTKPTVKFTEGVQDNAARPYGARDDNISYKTSEGVETMLYDEAPPTCWSRFRGEWKLKFFELSETDEAVIDVQRSFAPPPFWRSILLKLIITGWAISILVTDLVGGTWDPISYYFIYLAHWSLAITILYLLVSFINTAKGVPEQRPYEDIPSFMVRFAWGLFPTAAVSQLTTTILFWILQFDPNKEPVTYKMVMKHGGLMLLVLLEGRFINRIPVRQKHLLFPELFISLFVMWTGIHDAVGLGNPYQDGDAIYDSLDWRNNAVEAGVTTVVLILGVTPLLFLNVWLLSIWSFPFHFDGLNRNHYYLEEKEKQPAWYASMFKNWNWNWKGKKEKAAEDTESD